MMKKFPAGVLVALVAFAIGRVYSFEYQVVDTIQSSSSSVGDLFAGSIAYADNRLYVGARQADGNKGQVHVFLKNSSSWNEIEIIPSPHPSGGGLFSYWIDACADLLVVGARDLDSAFLFRWNETTLSHVAAGSLTPNNPPSGSFGTRTVFSDDCNSIVLCAPQDVGTGSGFLFVRNMSTFLFEETQKLLPPGGGAETNSVPTRRLWPMTHGLL